MSTCEHYLTTQRAYGDIRYIFKSMRSCYKYIMLMLRHTGIFETYGNIYNSNLTDGNVFILKIPYNE